MATLATALGIAGTLMITLAIGGGIVAARIAEALSGTGI
jgi:hypothetical protein